MSEPDPFGGIAIHGNLVAWPPNPWLDEMLARRAARRDRVITWLQARTAAEREGRPLPEKPELEDDP